MAIVDEVLEPDPAHPPVLEAPGAAPARARPRAWPRVIAGFVIGVALSLGIAAGALVAWDAGYEGRVLPGVHVGATDLSGLDRAGTIAALGAMYAGVADGQVVLRTEAGDLSVRFGAFSRRVDVEGMADEALAAGRGGGTLERASAEVRQAIWGRSIEPRLVQDEAALATAVLRALAPLDQAPFDAVIVKGAREIYTFPAREGRRFDARGAAAAAVAAVARIDAPGVVVVPVSSTEVAPAHSDDEVLAAKAAAERMITDVEIKLGGRHWTIRAAKVRTWISFTIATDGTVRPTVDGRLITRALNDIAKGIYREPSSATYLRSRSGRIVGVVAGANGRSLDPLATAAEIVRALRERGQGAEPAAIGAIVQRAEPDLTTDEALKKGPLMKRLGSWKTWFPISERNYFGANIWLPAKIINGTVLYPGQTFDWWRAIGPVTPARGFGPGGFIAGDHTEPTGALGGGMCSSSTTLFNAALRAGLQMGARSNHKYYITRYPLGLDATVSKTAGGSQTVTFTNDMSTPIVIRTFRYVSGGVGWVRYEIWGVPDGRTVSLTKPAVSNLRKATTVIVYVSTLPTGAREQTEYPSDGMDVSVTRVVRNREGTVIHTETYRSHYTLWNGRIEVGT